MDARFSALILFVAFLAAGLGAMFASRRYLRLEGVTALLAPAQGAAFGVLGLLLAFSFSVGLARFDARRAAVVNEANAISTLWYRADLLDHVQANALRGELRAYTHTRLAFLESDDAIARDAANRQSATLERSMWLTVMSGADRRTSATNLVIDAANALSSVSLQQSELQNASIPPSVLAIVLVTAIVAIALLGAGYSRSRRNAVVAVVTISIVIAAVYATILDLDRPHIGSIQLNLEPLRQTQSSLTQ